MSWLLAAAAVLFGISALLVVIRVTIGPTMLDRAISFDVLVSIAIGGIAVDAAVDRNTESVPILLVATLLGFVGSVSIARFTPGSDDVDDEHSAEPRRGTRTGGRL
ncbi:monovalent cation/H+ antiporter complex subunit F [Nocardioides lentus]|uniref:Monovalent cation/H+ antiporter complex subunit F n=1 Tax=Nocardioides lentus TaxID=338077 RepID=A0ABP5AB34_9ACTN